MEMSRYIRIDGVIDMMNNQMSNDEFWDRFIVWIEQNGWAFGGSTDECEEKEGEA